MKYQISQKGLVLNISNIEKYEARGSIIRNKARYKNDGTIYGAKFRNFAGYGWAMQFDGVGDYIEVPHSESLNIANTSFTLESIIKPASHIPNGSRFTVMGTWNPGWMIDLYNINGVEGYRFYSGFGSYMYHPPGNQISLEWTQFVITRDLSTNELKIYLNAELKQTWSMSSVQSSTNPLWIGRRSDGYFLNGLVAVTRIYNRILLIDEIRNNLYASWVYKMIRGLKPE